MVVLLFKQQEQYTAQDAYMKSGDNKQVSNSESVNLLF